MDRRIQTPPVFARHDGIPLPLSYSICHSFLSFLQSNEKIYLFKKKENRLHNLIYIFQRLTAKLTANLWNGSSLFPG